MCSIVVCVSLFALKPSALLSFSQCLTASEFGDEIKKSDIITPKDTKYGAGTKVTLERESASPLNTKTDLIMKSDSNSQETKPAEDKNNQEKKTNNINEVIVPVLNNLTACSMKIFEYSKAIMFCKQLLNIQPNNYKSLCRLSLSYIHIGEYNLALDILDQVDVTEGLSVTALTSEKQDRNEFEYSHTSTTSSVDQVDENLDSVEIEVSTEKEETKGNIKNDRIQYIKCLKYKAKLGLEKEKKNMKQQANALRKVLSKPISKDKIGDNIQELLLNTDLKCDFQNDREVRTNEIADSADRKMKRKESFMDLLFIIVWLFGVFVVSILIIKFIIFIY